MPTLRDQRKNSRSSSLSFSSYAPNKKYTLSDLRQDDEFNKTTERFLSSIGEGDSVGDLYGYFRGNDFNLYDGAKAWAESSTFTDQQKQDYSYLRSRFDNASVGGLGEWVRAGANITKEVVTDPTMAASIMFVPWTGGTSLAARLAAGKAVQSTIKTLANKNIAEGIGKGVAKLPGQTLKTPMSKTAKTITASTEGLVYGSTTNLTNQNVDLNTDRRDDINYKETAAVGALSAAVPFALRGVGKGVSSFNKSVADRRAARIDGNEDYKATIVDKGLEKIDSVVEAVTPNIRKITSFVNKPTAKFVEKMKESDTLSRVIKLFRYDTDRSMTAKDYNIAQKISDRSFYENVNKVIGDRSEQLLEIINPLKAKGKITKPKLGSRDAFFKVPFKEVKAQSKKSYFQYQRISDETNEALAYYLRTGRTTVTVDGKRVSFEKAFNLTEKTTGEIVTAGKGLRKLMTDIRNDAKSKGLEIGLIKNYLPRGFSYNAVKQEIKNLENGIEGKLVRELKEKEGFKTDEQVLEVLNEIINPSTLAGKSYTELATIGKGAGGAVGKIGQFSKRTPALTKERTLTNLDENNIAEYLDNNVESLMSDYVHQASSFIQRKVDLGEDLDEFITRFVKPIQDELAEKGQKLTSDELTSLQNIYLVSTGQVQHVDSAVLRTLSDIAIVGNQLALLPFATITSLSEIAVPLVRGAGKSFVQQGKAGAKKEIGEGGIRTMWKTASDYRKMWWNDVVKKDLADNRPEALKELNRFNRAVNRANEDRSLAMYGQGFGRRATQAQNKFFKVNLLHDWTRFVQLTAFNVGKSKMYENLYELSTKTNLTSTRKLRLENELSELGVDITEGIKWVKSGGKPSGSFYDDNFLQSAARYVDEVVMNPTAAANQKPLWHSMPSTRWAFGLMGFPTAFSNTVLKNAVREVSKDVRNREVKAIPTIGAGVVAMTGIAMFGNTMRTGGRNLEQLDSGEKDIGDEIFDAAVRTGLLGPTEQVYRTVKGTEYDNFLKSIVQRFTGPAVDDILRLTEDWIGPLAWFVDEVPGITALRNIDPEGYKAIKKAARDADAALGLTRAKKDPVVKPKEEVILFSTGGLVEGEDTVPYTKEDPADRINPYTGEPYQEQMDRLGFFLGGPLAEATFKQQEEVSSKLGEVITEREKNRVESRSKIAQAAKEGDIRKGFEGFEELPVGEQMVGYMNPITNVPLSVTGGTIYAEKAIEAGTTLRTPKEWALKSLKERRLVSPVKLNDPMSAGISALEYAGAIPGFLPAKYGSKTLRTITGRTVNANTMDGMGGGSRGSSGGSDKDKLGEFIDLYAKDDEGMYSSAVKSLIEDTPDNLKGKGLAQFINSKKFKSKVKDEELNILNLNKYIDENSQANLEDVIEYAGQNKVSVKTSEYADSYDEFGKKLKEGQTELFLEAEPVSADTKLFMVTNKSKSMTRSYEGHKRAPENYVLAYAEDLKSVQESVNKNDVDIANDLVQVAQKNFKINLPTNLSPLEKLSELKKSRQYPEIETTLAKQIYEGEPLQKIVPNPNSLKINGETGIDGTSLTRFFDLDSIYALRGIDGNYRIYADGIDMTPRIMGDRDIPQVEGKGYVLTNEAETKVQLQSFLEEEGLLKELSTMNEPKWKNIIDQNMSGGSNYREFVFNNDNAKIPSVFRSSHFPEEKNYLAHALVRDRDFQDGSNTLHIDELQSDLHQKGSKYGYITPQLDQEVDDITNKIWDEGQGISDVIKTEIDSLKKLEEDIFQERQLLKNKETSDIETNIRIRLKLLARANNSLKGIYRFDKADLKNNIKDRTTETMDNFEQVINRISVFQSYHPIQSTKNLTYAEAAAADPQKNIINIAESFKNNFEETKRIGTIYKQGIDDAPFKETWHQLSIKKLLKRAVDEGYGNLSISNSAPIVKRYEGMGEEGKELFYDRKVKNYMQKLAKSTGGEFKIKYLDNEYNIQGYKIMDDEFLRSYVIEITPELKELVSTKGLASFRKGGKVSTNEQMDRLGFSNGSAVLNYIAQARGYEDPAFLKQYADEVKWQETRGAGPTTVQNNNGPARGSYQVEGSQGSSRNETILQRAQNFYEKYPDAPKSKEITYALEQRGKDLDFSSLSEDTQDALFYMDAERGTLPLNELASGKLNHKTAWMNHWNQGPDQEVMEQKWDRAQEEKIIFLNSQDK